MAESVSVKMAGKEKKFGGKRLRVAVIGCGGIAQEHLRAMRLMPEVEVVAGVDIAQAALDRMETTWGLPKSALFTDWKKMLKVVKPDAVDVCTPNGVHCAPVVDACNAGCHAMVEKPMAMNPAECAKMIAAAKRNRVKLSVGFQLRYYPTTTALIEARDNGQFGKIMFVKCQALRRRGIPNWGVFGRKDLQGGGPMIDIGVHVLECAHAFLGSPKPVAASGNCWTFIGDRPSTTRCGGPNWDWKTYTVEDLAIGQIRFDNGAILQIESSFAGHLEKNVFNWTAMGEKAGCNWETAEIYTDLNNMMVNATPVYVGECDAFKAKLQNWVDAIRHGTPLGASGEAGLAVQKMLDGIYRSAALGKEVPIH
ncbi:MAG: Gfo/Idh/MocA family oxidoreductase [Kiritimatiellaeota bacterium]|nr:Gfo/Idh/MocA family oxidoreductase [Kiritimatiellota bacterium]